MRQSLSLLACVPLMALSALLPCPRGHAGGKVHEVMQINNTFVPENLSVEAGDTVRWIWSSGFHTVTSGAGCTADGFFDEPLDSNNPVVEIVMPEKEGPLPYFCRPHCFIDMVGTIVIEPAASCPADLDESGDVGFGDVLALLAAWGPYEPCPPFAAEDLDENCDIGFGDLLALLSAWGPCP